jgi:hypothetical protein
VDDIWDMCNALTEAHEALLPQELRVTIHP